MNLHTVYIQKYVISDDPLLASLCIDYTVQTEAVPWLLNLCVVQGHFFKTSM